MFPRPIATVTALTLLLAACGGDGPGTSAAAEGLDAPDRMLAWAPETVYSVGGFNAPDWATFGEVARVAFDEAGNLYLLDDQTAQVTVVSPTGEFLRTIGRRGDGPGEVGSPTGMEVLPDGRVVLSDMGKRGLVVYDNAGEWVGNVSLDLGEEGLPMGGLTAVGSAGVISENAIRMQMTDGGGARIARREAGPETRPVWLYPVAEGDSARLLHGAWSPPPPPEGGESTLEGGGDGGRRMMIQMARVQAFQPSLELAGLPDGRIALVDSTDYTVKLLDTSGEVVGRLQRPIPPTPVTDQIQEQERQRQMDELAGREGGGALRIVGGGGVQIDPAAMRQMMEERVANMAFYPEIPVIEELAADREGRLWVQRSSGVPGQDGPTDLITPDGRYLGSHPADGLRIPDAFGPGGLAAYIELDDLDVATVRVVRLPTEG